MTDLVVMSLEAWDGVWRRNQYLVAGLLRRDPALRVLFVEPAADPLYEASLRRRPRFGRGLRAATAVPGVGDGRLWTFQPTKALPRRIDPSVDARAARAVRRAARRVGFRTPLLWVNDPGAAAVLEATRWRALYDITDDWLLADRSPAEHDRLVRDEGALMAGCAEVVVCSPALAQVKGAIRPVTLVPNAVDLATYRHPAPRPADLPPGPVAVYVGTVHRDRMDLELCAATAGAIEGIGRLVLVGPAPLAPADRDRLVAAGVVLLGAKDRSEVPAYLQHSDVLVVPHVVTPFTDSLDPIKAYEYRAVARPVVSTPVAGFRDHHDTRTLVVPAEDFAQTVRRLLVTPSSGGLDGGDDPPTWDDRVTQMGEVLARVAGSRPPVRRIGLNGKWTGQSLTGTQRYASEITRRLVAGAPGSYVLRVPADGAVPDWASGVRVHRSRLRGTLFEQIALPWAARREVLLSLGGPAPLPARRQVVTMHDATPFRFPQTYSRVFGAWYRLLYRVLARRAERVLTVSRFSAAELAEVLGVPQRTFTVVPNGSDHLDGLEPSRPDLPLDDGAPFALCVGTLARHKNLGPVLGELDRAGIRTVVVGPRGSRRVFDEATGTVRGAAEGWRHAVAAGRLSDAEILWLYRHAAALVFPSRYEGFGLPIVEAQRAGCPVIASDLPFAREVADDGALFVDPDRPSAAVEAFRRLTAEPDLRGRLVDAGLRNAERYLWDASARGVLAVLREIHEVPA